MKKITFDLEEEIYENLLREAKNNERNLGQQLRVILKEMFLK